MGGSGRKQIMSTKWNNRFPSPVRAANEDARTCPATVPRNRKEKEPEGDTAKLVQLQQLAGDGGGAAKAAAEVNAATSLQAAHYDEVIAGTLPVDFNIPTRKFKVALPVWRACF